MLPWSIVEDILDVRTVSSQVYEELFKFEFLSKLYVYNLLQIETQNSYGKILLT